MSCIEGSVLEIIALNLLLLSKVLGRIFHSELHNMV